MKGNYIITDLKNKEIAVGYQIPINIGAKCKYYYGENKVSLKQMKKLIKKAGNNCYISFGVTVKNNKAMKIGLYS